MNFPVTKPVIKVASGIELKRLRLESSATIFLAIDQHRHTLRTWLPFIDHTWKVSDTENFIKSVLRAKGVKNDLVYEIYFEQEFAGLIALKEIDPWNKKSELGYWLIPSFERKGIMVLSGMALIDYAFNTLGLHRIQIKVAVGNSRSSLIPEKLGFTLEGIERSGEKFTDHFIDLEVYSLLKNDHPPVTFHRNSP